MKYIGYVLEVRHYFDNFWINETSTVHKDQRRDDIVNALRSLNHDSVYNVIYLKYTYVVGQPNQAIDRTTTFTLIINSY